MELAYSPPTSQHALTHNHEVHQQIDFTQQSHIQPINYSQQIPIARENMQIDDMETYQSQPVNQAVFTSEIEKYNPNIGKLPEMTIFWYSLSDTYVL